MDHIGIEIGDVRVKVVDNNHVEESFLGSLLLTTKNGIQKRLSGQKEFYFLHYNDELKNVKVKSIGTKK